jgi:putative heme-binding domain-containing protein
LVRFAHFPQLVANLAAKLPAADQRIIDLIAQRKQGYQTAKPDANRGAQVFAKSVCANCHRVGELGKNLGPGLDGIGVRGLDRLLEDILNPSQNVDQSFRTVMVATDDGQIFSGFGLREEDAHLILHDNEGKPRRLPLEEVTDRRTSTLSPMPSGAIEQIPEPDFYDLLAYLLSQRSMTTK